MELAKGRSWAEIEADLPGTAEGAYTVQAALELADRLGVEMPIAREVQRALFEGKSVQRCLVDLLARESKDELADASAWIASLGDARGEVGRAARRGSGARLGAVGAWRSLVAHQSGGLVVVGSNPAAPTTFST